MRVPNTVNALLINRATLFGPDYWEKNGMKHIKWHKTFQYYSIVQLTINNPWINDLYKSLNNKELNNLRTNLKS